MSARLRYMDERATVALSAPETTVKGDASTISSMTAGPPLEIAAQPDIQRNQFGFAFEEDLLASRVYRKPLYSRSGASLVSSAARTTSSSVLSGLSLTEVSNISILAVPIYAHEIRNSERYTFGDFLLPPLEEVLSQESADQSTISTPKPRKRDRLTVAVWRQRKEKSPTPKRESLPVQITPANSVFGIALYDSVRLANVAISLMNEAGESFVYGYVPLVVAKFGVFLKEKATEVENIFNISGSVARLTTLQAAFNEPPRYGKGLDWSGFTVHDAAAILLRYLYQLPEPVIPLDSYEAFQQPLKEQEGKPIPSEDFRTQYIIRQYQKLIRELPPLSRQLLLYLLDFLAVFASKADLNHVTPQKLAQQFQPTIFSLMEATSIRSIMLEELSNRQLSQDVMVFLVDNQDNFLIGMEGTSDNVEPEAAVPTDPPIEDLKVPPRPLKKSSSF
ncbi:MAG: GTPase activating protein (GAP) for Rho1p [Ramalina farinacea]|uniref:GTPase activating protein (GAP) for Rho1p n=1 Tax=Ramalina farinacea TaxID=258253 RepID=A0AA43QJB0_9LECA|nr:GTPase activating protein (GAP) for Rho1p [Ramalina farinacea]